MPLLMCPNDDAAMQTMERGGVQFDMCPTCRGVWLDRGELEKLMEAATAEVTLGGVDTAALDQATLQAKAAPGLYFIGEAVDVTGWLGGYNFQWAWSSGWVAGQSC